MVIGNVLIQTEVRKGITKYLTDKGHKEAEGKALELKKEVFGETKIMGSEIKVGIRKLTS